MFSIFYFLYILLFLSPLDKSCNVKQQKQNTWEKIRKVVFTWVPQDTVSAVAL